MRFFKPPLEVALGLDGSCEMQPGSRSQRPPGRFDVHGLLLPDRQILNVNMLF